MIDDAYVYAILVDGVVRYIGKGSGAPLKRAREHARTARRLLRRRAAGQRTWERLFYNRLAKSLENGEEVREVCICDGLSHEEAFAREIVEITAAPKGQLWNSESGGLGGNRASDETRELLSIAGKRRAAQPGERQRLRQLALDRASDPACIATLSVQAKARWSDPELAERMKAGLDKGRKAPRSPERNKKRWAKPEAGQKHAAAMLRKWADPVFKAKQERLIKERTYSAQGKLSQAKMLAARWADPLAREKQSAASKAAWAERKAARA